MKKMGLIVLMVMLILTQLPAAPAKADNSLFVFDRNEGMITGYNGTPPANLLIPDALEGVAVTGIAAHAFADKQLTFVHIPYTVEYIGEEAFAGNNLRMVRFDWVTATIGTDAFSSQVIDGGFEGWFTNLELTNPWNGDVPPGDFTIYSTTPATFTVHFESNGGSSFSSVTFLENDFLNIWQRPEKPGLAFDGWYKNPELTDKLDFIDMITGDMTLYAKWTNPFTTVKNSDDAWTITGYQGDLPTDLIIPEEIDGINVTRIGNEAFRNGNLQSVVLPSTLEWISEKAFWGNQLTNIVIPDNVSYIGQFAFSDNNLQNVTWPSALESIADYVFNGNQLTNIVIPDSVTYIGYAAFAGNALTNLTISDSVQAIGGFAFQDNQLTSLIIPDNVRDIGMFAFENNKLTNLRLSENMTIINYSSFSRNKLTEITIPNSITYIDEFAFYENKLVNVTLPESITNIEALAFGDNQLTDIALPNSVESIGIGAFMDNKLTNIVIPEKVTVIEDSAFENNKLNSVTMPEGITEIKGLAFKRNDLTSVQIPSTVTQIGKEAFQRNKLTNLTIPNSVTFMGEWAFSDNQLTSVHLPDGITKIEDYTFFNNKLTEITLPESVTQIGEFAFDGSNLTNVLISKNVTSIGQGAFLENKLEKVVFQGAVDTIGIMAFGQQNLSNPKFKGWFTDYALTERWNESVPQAMSMYSVAPTTYTVLFETNGGSPIAAKIIAEGEKLPSLEISTKIDYTFAGWYKDKNLQIPWDIMTDTVTEDVTLYAKWVDNSLFTTSDNGDGTIAITGFKGKVPAELVIPHMIYGKNVTAIAANAFKNKHELQQVTLPENLQKIGKYAFAETSLSGITIPSTVTVIESYAFNNSKLQTVMLNEGLQIIGTDAFLGNEISNISIPSTVKKINDRSFYDNKIVKIEFKGAIPTLGNELFDMQFNNTVLAWYVDGQISQVWDKTVPQAMTLYLKPLLELYTVTFNTNGGSAVISKTVSQNDVITAPAAPTKANHTFAGWYKEPTFQTAWNFATDKVTANITLYAKWNVASPNVTAPSTPSTTPAPSTSNQITVNVVDASNPDEVLVQTVINRDSSGDVVKDTVKFTATNASESIEKLANRENKKSRIVIPDEQQQVSETTIDIEKEAAQLLAQGQTGLEIDMETVKLAIPATSLADFNEDLYFRIVPVKSRERQEQLEERAAKEEVVQQLAGNAAVTLLGQPMTIETNIQNRPVTLTLPLPNDVTQEQLDNLAVYIEHSDGTKEVVRGQIVAFKEGVRGIQFEVTKFSTFSILYMPKAEEIVEEKISVPYIRGYADGTFRPNAPVTRAQMASMLARYLTNNEIPEVQASFTDTTKHGAKDAIEYVRAQGLFQGTSATTFNPNGSITRAQMAAVAVRWIEQHCAEDSTVAYCVTSNAAMTFTDVAPNHWAASAIAKINALNLMTGTSATTFNPEGDLTRAQAVKVLNQLFEQQLQTDVHAPLFTDVQPAHWAFEEIQAAAQ
ncbi:leucine-rich repeat protein [Metasolibacillus sp. FSL H7-0170]|uniref:leucine-rich repeat protein n=1 Tax=Metasolibacillus sp. FSL H7-0170 TaxID=2921431 RepID=UPI0031598F37